MEEGKVNKVPSFWWLPTILSWGCVIISIWIAHSNIRDHEEQLRTVAYRLNEMRNELSNLEVEVYEIYKMRTLGIL